MTANRKQALDEYSQAIQDSAINSLPLAAVGGLASGAAIRGLTGLLNSTRKRKNRAQYPGAVIADLPVLPPEEKAAADPVYTTRMDVPWYLPAAATTVGLGMMGGYKGMDMLLDHRRKLQREKDLAEAQQEFRSALSQTLTPHPTFKAAADAGDLSSMLDHLYDAAMQKQAVSPLGLYGLYAAATGLPAAYYGYQVSRKAQERAMLEEAMAARKRHSYTERPSEVLIEPTVADTATPEKISAEQFRDFVLGR